MIGAYVKEDEEGAASMQRQINQTLFGIMLGYYQIDVIEEYMHEVR